MIQYREFDSSRLDEVKEIYESENRSAYLRDDAKLRRAFDGGHILPARDLTAGPNTGGALSARRLSGRPGTDSQTFVCFTSLPMQTIQSTTAFTARSA